jgi:hypothetical protein
MKQIPIFFLLIFLVLSCRPDQQATQDSWNDLFNGKDLSGWYTWQGIPEPTSYLEGLTRDAEGNYLEPIGKNNDPLNVFTVVLEDGQPAIRISGENYGILVTEKIFENYHLRLEFKWGDESFPPRENELKDSGILYHSMGPEGAWGGVWMKSLECQVMEQSCGDFICVDTTFADIPAERPLPDERFRYNSKAKKITFSPEQGYCQKNQDYEKPAGEWNVMEIYTFGNESIHTVNGHLNMHTYNLRYLDHGKEVPLSKGKIQLQSEGAEIFYRNVQIKPIKAIPEEI